MNLFEMINEMLNNNKSFVVCTVAGVSGSTPGKIGFKMIVNNDGSTIGTVGGGELEVRVKNDALKRLNDNQSGLNEYILSNKENILKENKDVVPMMCNGKVVILYETFGRNPSVYIFGGGHVGSALVNVLAKLNYHVVIIDNRPEFAAVEKHPNAAEVINEDYINYSEKFEPPADSYAVVMTHGHNYDFEVAKRLYERNLPLKYIGVIASKHKAADLKDKLIADLGSSIDFKNFHSPIGLKIGGDTAEEIAISIAAEMQSVRYDKQIN
ncbi:MAG: XdhC/CoxI family protein [Melioribacteraceae bacterium]|nr:XdhC/CoxI family protein [Melioribacteraceae bacterium]MCF8356392.1 XdhC/CoxI family protein [Melioribacteraceae bacterium]MCF8392253.1 XdhC/CoxI family protein [Melioribacteraceae bacterium]MCF8417585.1 XdhC/CoxI family protein [Melioribacteraceae bacterium]